MLIPQKPTPSNNSKMEKKQVDEAIKKVNIRLCYG